MFDCPNCGNALPDGATFCNQCWQAVSSTDQSAGDAATTVLGEPSAAGVGPTPSTATPTGPPAGAPAFEPPYRPPGSPIAQAPGYPASPPPPPPLPPPGAWGPGGGPPPSPWSSPGAGPTPLAADPYAAGYAAPSPGYGAPGYGAPAYGGAGYGGYAPAPSPNGLAIASLVCSLATVLTCVTAIPGVILGHIALSQIKRSDGRQGGRSLALAGVIIGYAFLALGVFIVVMFAIADTSNTG